MQYFLTREAVLRWLERPSVYHIKKDELYELDDEAFEFLKKCSSENGCNAGDREFVNYCLKEGILTKEPPYNKIRDTKTQNDNRRPSIKKSPVPSLRYLELQITNRCNLRCRHCYISNNSVAELSVARIKNILHEFEGMQGLRVLITGGEPLIHSRFEDINKILPEFFTRKTLLTNGLLLNRQLLKRLNVNEIQISVDGLEKAHDALRGKGSFRKAIKAIELSVDSGLEVSISTMIHFKNLYDFDKMEKLFKKIGIKEWVVDVPCITGRLEKNIEFWISPETAREILSYGFGGYIHSGESDFGCGLHLMSVSAEGNISKCTFYSDKPVGTIKNGLRKSWQKMIPVRLDELKCDCEHLEHCRGGCRYRAELLGGPRGKDLYRCALYQ